MTSNAIPTRKQEKIGTTICRRCFVAIPDDPDQRDRHMQWHDARDEKAEK